jgi:nitrite reductase (NADH) small subunit
MISWTFICHIDDIPRLGARRVARASGLDVAIFRSADDQIFALLDSCPHKGGPLSQGLVFGTSVACPLHNWTISLCSGQAAAPDEGCTPKFAVQVEAGAVYLDAAELDSHATTATRPLAGPCQRSAAASAP